LLSLRPHVHESKILLAFNFSQDLMM
jgi:hypothetical protein